MHGGRYRPHLSQRPGPRSTPLFPARMQSLARDRIRIKHHARPSAPGLMDFTTGQRRLACMEVHMRAGDQSLHRDSTQLQSVRLSKPADFVACTPCLDTSVCGQHCFTILHRSPRLYSGEDGGPPLSSSRNRGGWLRSIGVTAGGSCGRCTDPVERVLTHSYGAACQADRLQ